MASLLALCLISVSEAAWAHGFARGGPGRPGFAGGVPEQLIFPCRADCRDAAQTCAETAEADAVTCAQNACSSISLSRQPCRGKQLVQCGEDSNGDSRSEYIRFLFVYSL